MNLSQQKMNALQEVSSFAQKKIYAMNDKTFTALLDHIMLQILETHDKPEKDDTTILLNMVYTLFVPTLHQEVLRRSRPPSPPIPIDILHYLLTESRSAATSILQPLPDDKLAEFASLLRTRLQDTISIAKVLEDPDSPLPETEREAGLQQLASDNAFFRIALISILNEITRRTRETALASAAILN